ncbi:MAG: DUF948 domain-containing protein [Nitrospirae bacterium]|nr:DUF948 domain-containing protein [Nitrospirota bacterium]
MTERVWLVILSIGFLISAAGILVAIGMLSRAIMDIRRLAATINEFVKNTEERLTPVLIETEQTLKSFRKISDDVGTVTENVRGLSDVVYEIVVNLKTVSNLVNSFGEGVSLRASGIREGVKTALNVLIRQIKERR